MIIFVLSFITYIFNKLSLDYRFRYNATIKMFRDIGDKFGLIQAQIGIAKCLAQCKRFRDSMNSYQLAVTSCHETDNKVRIAFNLCVAEISESKYLTQ